jgi:hypothetical protein
MLTLKTVLFVNGISSAVTGLGLVSFAAPVATVFGLDQKAPFTFTGVFLIVFGLYVLSTALSKVLSLHAVKLITILDIVWVLASIAVVAIDGSKISVIGNISIIAVAAWVALMAALQSRGLKQKLVMSRL